jgi:hypothetical protein
MKRVFKAPKEDAMKRASADVRTMEVLKAQLAAETETKNEVIKALAMQTKI